MRVLDSQDVSHSAPVPDGCNTTLGFRGNMIVLDDYIGPGDTSIYEVPGPLSGTMARIHLGRRARTAAQYARGHPLQKRHRKPSIKIQVRLSFRDEMKEMLHACSLGFYFNGRLPPSMPCLDKLLHALMHGEEILQARLHSLYPPLRRSLQHLRRHCVTASPSFGRPHQPFKRIWLGVCEERAKPSA